MMKMKKRVAVVLLFALCLAQIPVAPKAKTKKVKSVSYTHLTLPTT